MQVSSLHCFKLFAILLLFVDFSGAKDVITYPDESQISSRPPWNTSIICPNSHYLNLPGDEVALQFVGTRVTVNFESTDLNTVNVMFALISINNTDVATINTVRSSKCSPIPWTSDALPRGRHTLRVTQMNHSDHVYIRSFSYISMAQAISAQNELKCYGLPYGALGFLSHLLALYTLLCLINRRKAYLPWSRIEPGKHTAFDIVLSVITFVATVSLTSITMARCKNNWQYILLAVENLCLSNAISAISLSSSLDISKESHLTVSYVMCIFTFIGGIVGGVGYISLIVQNWSNKNVKIAFGSILGTGFALGIVAGIITTCVRKLPNFLSVVVFAHLFGVAMADWVLGAIADDIPGIPHGKIAILIWLYFAVRRLPMLVS